MTAQGKDAPEAHWLSHRSAKARLAAILQWRGNGMKRVDGTALA